VAAGREIGRLQDVLLQQAAPAEELARVQAALLDRAFARELAGWGWHQHHLARRVQVPAALREGVTEGAGRPGFCFQVARQYVLDHADQPVVLVAGWVWEPTEPGGPPLPWSHAWVELPEQDAVLCPTTGRFYDRRSYHVVLRCVPLEAWTTEEVIGRLEAGGTSGLWAPGFDAHRRLAAQVLVAIDRAVPGLRAWIEGMLDRDPRFAAGYRQWTDADRSGLAEVQIHVWLAHHPQWWRDYRPGQAWEHPLHPYDTTGWVGVRAS